MKILLDTNIVSYVEKEHSTWLPYRPLVEGNTPLISFMTVAEIYDGVYRAQREGKPYQRYLKIISKYRIIPCSHKICEIWGRIRADRYRRPIAVDDAFIAATAVAYEIPLVTHNPADFEDIPGLQLLTRYGV